MYQQFPYFFLEIKSSSEDKNIVQSKSSATAKVGIHVSTEKAA
jgi:hypothetical protein